MQVVLFLKRKTAHYMSVMLEPPLPEPVTRQKERYTNGELVSIWYE